jgi:hypothetical protein
MSIPRAEPHATCTTHARRQYDEYIANVDIRTEFVDNKTNHQRVVYKFTPYTFTGQIRGWDAGHKDWGSLLCALLASDSQVGLWPACKTDGTSRLPLCGVLTSVTFLHTSLD